ncbi:MAG: hypothetical protein AB1757_05335 [Acidobacteriota bacterium]
MLDTIAVTIEPVDTINTTEPYHDTSELERLIAAFEACSLPKPKWTHQAHLMVALWYNLHYDPEPALNKVREAILAYNAATGTLQTPTGGYHETMTIFWMWAVRAYLAGANEKTSIVELANGLLRSKYAERKFPFVYYSAERLFSWDARTAWMEPDIGPLK